MSQYPLKRTPIEAFGLGQVDVFGGFLPNGTSAPTGVIGGWIKSITRTAVGTFTVKFDQSLRPKDLIGLAAQYVNDNANPGLSSLALGAVTNTAGSDITVVLYTLVSGALADIAANAASKVRFQLRFKMYAKADSTGL